VRGRLDSHTRPYYAAAMRSAALLLACLVLASCATAPAYDESWTWDSQVFDEQAVLGQAGLLSSQQDAFFTSLWTLGSGALRRRQEYQLRKQHELWVRRQVELKRMSVEEAYARIWDYTPSKEH
jgi:hypothetical protein